MLSNWRLRSRAIILVVVSIATISTLLYSYTIFSMYKNTRMHIESSSNDINERIINHINRFFSTARLTTLNINRNIQDIELTKPAIWKMIHDLSLISEVASGIGIYFFPYALNESTRLFSPYIYRSFNSYKRANLDEQYDYSLIDQESENLSSYKKPYWSSPFYDEVNQCESIRYVVPVITNGKQLGIGYTNYCIKDVANDITQNYLFSDSYFMLIDKNKNILYNSSDHIDKYQLDNVQLDQDNSWSSQQTENGNISWVHSTKIDGTDWYIVTTINKDMNRIFIDEMALNKILTKVNKYFPLTALIVFTLILWIIYLISKCKAFTTSNLWVSSFLISMIFTTGTLYIWNQFYINYNDNVSVQKKVHNTASIRRMKLQYNIKSMNQHKAPPIFVPTSLFIQSMQFITAYNVKITGYIWQKYPIKSQNTESDINYGVVFPEAESINIKKSYEHRDNNFLTIGWRFEGLFREKFNYDLYPFDQQLVWIRVWHTDFKRNVVLTPIIDSYKNINPASLPGLEKEFVINGWSIDRTFYDYRSNQYNTNFGMPAQLSKNGRPELYFNISLRRNFINPFISYLFPVLIVLLMLFGVLIITHTNTKKTEHLGFSASSVLSSSSALFFVSLISHVQLRSHVGSNRMIFLEYFFIVSYVMVIMVVLNAILFSLPVKIKLIDYRDNLIPKILFWPLLSGVFFLITLVIHS